MINWLLAAAEQNPCARFSSAFLSDQLEEGFQEARTTGLLRFCELVVEGSVFDHRRGRLFSLRAQNQAVLGIDEEDPSYPPVLVSEDYRVTWEIDLAALADRLRSALSLAGQSAQITDRLYLLGTLDVPASEAVLVTLALFPSPVTAIPNLLTLRDRLPLPSKSIALLLPTLRLRGDERTLLRAHRLLPVELGGADPSAINLEEALGDVRGTRTASTVPSAPTARSNVLGSYGLAELRQKYTELQPRGRRARRDELAAALSVHPTTLYRHLRSLGVSWSEVIAPS